MLLHHCFSGVPGAGWNCYKHLLLCGASILCKYAFCHIRVIIGHTSWGYKLRHWRRNLCKRMDHGAWTSGSRAHATYFCLQEQVGLPDGHASVMHWWHRQTQFMMGSVACIVTWSWLLIIQFLLGSIKESKAVSQRWIVTFRRSYHLA